jgi:RNA polymerase sigma-70 factor (ECF subfamily)
LSEAALIQQARAGNEAAWLALVTMYQEPVFRLAYLHTRDVEEADDVAQETMIRAFRFLDRFDASQPLRPWLLKITRNVALNRRRALSRYWAMLRRAERQVHTHVMGGSEGEPGTVAEEVWLALQTLDRKDQEVIYLRYFLELSVAETALALAVAEGTVKSRLARALARLRGVLEREFPALAEEYAA